MFGGSGRGSLFSCFKVSHNIYLLATTSGWLLILQQIVLSRQNDKRIHRAVFPTLGKVFPRFWHALRENF